ncbi:hypothetical protein H9P43_008141 [Blastocladiella emersonii ATCC 22665]|nr:hypothetical protein H9P43_008141 [Blastocladiella emersonii ATCC 22665]
MMMFSAPAKVPSTALLLPAHEQQQSSSSFATLPLAGEDYRCKSEKAFKLPLVPSAVASVKHAFGKFTARLPRIVPRPGKRDTNKSKQSTVPAPADPFAELTAPAPFAACGDLGSDNTLVVPHPSPAADKSAKSSPWSSSSLSPRLAWAAVKARLSRRAAPVPVAGGKVVVVDELHDEFFADDDEQPAVMDFVRF